MTPTLRPEPQRPSRAKRKSLVLAVAAVVAVLIGVGAFALLHGGGPSTGTVTGAIVLVSDPASAPQPKLASAEVDLSLSSTGGSTKTIHVGPSGRFQVSLAPGQWNVDDVVAAVGTHTSYGELCQVTVTPGHTSSVTVQIDVTNMNSSREQCY
ncbi:MAG TPA: hypothetical protein VGZ03_01275 [Acidimicrobiales bacterium]|jgi:hypothetical protein|nr:hypothetical protein [Acidimicrobiales bacterium]